MKKLFLISVLSMFFVACSSLQTISLTQIPKDRSQVVNASVEKWIILGFNFNNDFINPITEDIKQQCPNGEVRGILTKDEAVKDFLFWHKRKVSVTGYCV